MHALSLYHGLKFPPRMCCFRNKWLLATYACKKADLKRVKFKWKTNGKHIFRVWHLMDGCWLCGMAKRQLVAFFTIKQIDEKHFGTWNPQLGLSKFKFNEKFECSLHEWEPWWRWWKFSQSIKQIEISSTLLRKMHPIEAPSETSSTEAVGDVSINLY